MSNARSAKKAREASAMLDALSDAGLSPYAALTVVLDWYERDEAEAWEREEGAEPNLPTGWDEGCAVMRRLDAATADAMRTLRRDLEAMGVFPCEVNE